MVYIGRISIGGELQTNKQEKANKKEKVFQNAGPSTQLQIVYIWRIHSIIQIILASNSGSNGSHLEVEHEFISDVYDAIIHRLKAFITYKSVSSTTQS